MNTEELNALLAKRRVPDHEWDEKQSAELIAFVNAAVKNNTKIIIMAFNDEEPPIVMANVVKSEIAMVATYVAFNHEDAAEHHHTSNGEYKREGE